MNVLLWSISGWWQLSRKDLLGVAYYEMGIVTTFWALMKKPILTTKKPRNMVVKWGGRLFILLLIVSINWRAM